MITAYCSNSEAVTLNEEGAPSFPDGTVWLDLINPTKSEEDYVERLLGIEVPTREDLKDIEPSSRLYTENGAVFMTASLVCRADSEVPILADIGFILAGDRLVTIRYAEPKAFGLFAAGLRRMPDGCRSGTVLLSKLMETIVDRTAEILEHAELRIDSLSLKVFGDRARANRRQPRHLEDRLFDVAGHHRLVSKARDSLASLARLMTYLYTVPMVQEDRETKELCRSISRDIQSLSGHASFIAGNITFLLDASLGLINVEQNAIIKIFSIASVVLLPPTMVASIYGMNFAFMPELKWELGYPVALVLMLLSAIIPFFFFRWKGWL